MANVQFDEGHVARIWRDNHEIYSRPVRGPVKDDCLTTFKSPDGTMHELVGQIARASLLVHGAGLAEALSLSESQAEIKKIQTRLAAETDRNKRKRLVGNAGVILDVLSDIWRRTKQVRADSTQIAAVKPYATRSFMRSLPDADFV